MRLLIFEPALTGHHGPYLRHLLEATSTLGLETTVVTRGDAADTPEFRLHLADVSSLAEFDAVINQGKKTVSHASAMVAQLQQAIDRHRPDHVWVPYADGLAQIMGARALTLRAMRLPSGTELEGLFFRGSFAYPHASFAKRVQHRMSRFLVGRSRWQHLHFLDPLPYELVQRCGGALARCAKLMPEPVEATPDTGRQVARAQLGIPSDGRYLCCAGRLNENKGAHLVLEAFANARLRPTDRLLFAGPTSPSVRRLLDENYAELLNQRKIVALDRHMSVDEITLSLLASDVVCTPYPHHIGSASFVIRAAATGRRLVASNFGWIGWAVKRFDLGYTCNVWQTEHLIRTMTQALDEETTGGPGEAAKRFCAYHSPDNFRAHWTARLRERLNLPPSDDRVSWDWVTEAAGG